MSLMEILLAVVVVQLGMIWWGLGQVIKQIGDKVADANDLQLEVQREIVDQLKILKG